MGARNIAAQHHVSHDFVVRLKSSLSSDDSEESTAYTTKHSTQAAMKTGGLAKERTSRQKTSPQKTESGETSGGWQTSASDATRKQHEPAEAMHRVG